MAVLMKQIRKLVVKSFKNFTFYCVNYNEFVEI